MSTFWLRHNLWLSALLLAAGCTSETVLETEELTESRVQPVCQQSKATRVFEDVENACSCLVEETSQVLEDSCSAGMGPEMLGRVTALMYQDCSAHLAHCEATMDQLNQCSRAANFEFADACSVGFPDECLSMATARGCAFYVGCPTGYHIETEDGAASCVKSD